MCLSISSKLLFLPRETLAPYTDVFIFHFGRIFGHLKHMLLSLPYTVYLATQQEVADYLLRESESFPFFDCMAALIETVVKVCFFNILFVLLFF